MRKIIMIMALIALPQSAFAWGAAGHRYIAEVAARNFPVEIPAFLRSPEAIAQLGLLASEPDISRNSGQPHDADLDPGHYVKVSEDGSFMGGPRLSALPPTRRDFDTALRAAGSDQYAIGFLPYNMMDGYQQLVKDFAILRMTMAAEKYAAKFSMTADERRSFDLQRQVRETLTLRDLGWWSHFVGDASMPMHASIHLIGWVGPNPRGFNTDPGVHSKFESVFVDANIAESDVAAKIKPYHVCHCTLVQRTQDYLSANFVLVVPTYEFDKAGAFDNATPESKAFVVGRLAEGATQLRDLVTDAWEDAGKAILGHLHPAKVADLEAGLSDPRRLN